MPEHARKFQIPHPSEWLGLAIGLVVAKPTAWLRHLRPFPPA